MHSFIHKKKKNENILQFIISYVMNHDFVPLERKRFHFHTTKKKKKKKKLIICDGKYMAFSYCIYVFHRATLFLIFVTFQYDLHR
jgi:hypothetical protein